MLIAQHPGEISPEQLVSPVAKEYGDKIADAAAGRYFTHLPIEDKGRFKDSVEGLFDDAENDGNRGTHALAGLWRNGLTTKKDSEGVISFYLVHPKSSEEYAERSISFDPVKAVEDLVFRGRSGLDDPDTKIEFSRWLSEIGAPENDIEQ